MQCKTKWNAKKVKLIENCSKNWVKSTKYASCTSGQQYFLSLSRSHQLEVQDQMKKNKCTFTLVKNDSNECKTYFGVQKSQMWS